MLLDLPWTIGRTQSVSESRPNTAKLAAIRAHVFAMPRGGELSSRRGANGTSRRPFPLVANGRSPAYLPPTALKIGMFASLAT